MGEVWEAQVATCPDSYEERLAEMHPGLFRYLRLLALDPHDLALTKLTRNAERDRSDVEYLAGHGRAAGRLGVTRSQPA